MLVFIPNCLKEMDDAPSFTLRAATWREKEHRLDLRTELGVVSHGEDELREELANGIRNCCADEDRDQYLGWITSYWDAQDAHRTMVKDDPDARFEFDPGIEAMIIEVSKRLQQTWPPLARMAKNIDKDNRLGPAFFYVCLLTDWTGLKTVKRTERRMDRLYLTMDCAVSLTEELYKLDQKHGLKPGQIAAELYVACLQRMYLDEEEAKNSASPSPSSESPPPSNETPISAGAGKSKAPARSKKTPVSA